MQCGMRNISKCIKIIDSYDGKEIISIPLITFSKETISCLISDLIDTDIRDQHGLIIKYDYNYEWKKENGKL